MWKNLNIEIDFYFCMLIPVYVCLFPYHYNLLLYYNLKTYICIISVF